MKNIKDEFLQQYRNEVLSITKLPKQIIEQYNLEACFKHTQDKQTYLLCSRLNGDRYILKQTSRFFKENLQKEYIMLSLLDHPTISLGVDYMEDEQCSYLVRQYVPGNSLFDLVGSGHWFTEEKTIEAVIAVCNSLAYLHHQSPPVVHGDIKPQNVILTPEGEYHLINFGILRNYKDSATQATAAPEQFLYGQNDKRSDIYSLGMLMVFLLTGGFDIIDSKLRTASKPMLQIITKCLSFNPDQRYADVGMIKSKLERCLKKKKKLPKK